MECPECSLHGFNSEEEEDEFRSCRGEDDERWGEEDTEDSSEIKELDGDLDEFSLRVFFKGLSVVSQGGEEGSSPSGVSGIGVVMERSPGIPTLQIQKKLDFHTEDQVVELLALMDGLLEAHNRGVLRVFAFTDSDAVHNQIGDSEQPEDQLLAALGQRIQEHANKFETFVLKLVPICNLNKPLLLAQEAIGIYETHHLAETVRCPFPNCLMSLGPRGGVVRNKTESSSTMNCVECPDCQRLLCLECVVPWHVSMSCEEFKCLPLLTTAAGSSNEDVMLHHHHHHLELEEDNNWRQCEQCRRVIERTQGCQLMTCWCGHEFCYSCGSEYRNGLQSCHCFVYEMEDDEVGGGNLETTTSIVHSSNQESELWRWESFELPMSTMDAYTEQERSQLALIQRFLAGGFGLGDQNPCQSPPRPRPDTFVDTIKDLHQLPWLERFVSVISDNYQEEYTQ